MNTRTSEKVMPREKRFVTLKQYGEMTGLSYATISHLCESGQLSYITTESGLRRIDTREQGTDNAAILARLDKQEKMLTALCNQFNTGGM